MRRHELETVHIELSVLSPLRPFPVRDEVDLLEQLRPGHDGLVLQAGAYHATFLPKVWESLPTPRRFVGELKRKAGLPADFWHEDIQLFRYHTETFGEPAEAPALSIGKAKSMSAPNPQTVEKTERTITNRINVRASPNIRAALLITLTPGQKITVESVTENREWHQITYAGRRKGFVYSDVLRLRSR